jgi:glycosidase
MIYYGDEAGVEGEYAEDGRRPYPWGKEDKQLLEFYRTAVNARRNSPALSEGDVRTVWIDDRGGYGFTRTHDSEQVIALFNNSDSPLEAEISQGDSAEVEWRDLLGKLPNIYSHAGKLGITLPPLTAGWFGRE